MINRRSGFLILIFIVQSWVLHSQEARITLQWSKDQVTGWNISDGDYNKIQSSEMFTDMDSIHFFLPSNKRYFLDISLENPGFTDSSMVNLLINGNDILTILDTEEGDMSLPFFTGNTGDQLKIIGGTDADIEDFPWQAYLRAGRYLCGGSIIGEKWVLTAAHCALDENDEPISATNMSVKVGTAFPEGNAAGIKYYIDSVIIHEDYSSDGFLNDIALLVLSDSIDFSVANYIELISEEEIAAGVADPGVLSWVTGWGLTAVDPDEFPSILQKVQLPIVSNETVRGVWGEVSESILMAGYVNGNKDACSGDSGGPLVVPVGKNFRLAGIVSWGDTNCSTYGAYTRVSYFEDWIRGHSGIERRFIPDEPYGDSIICETEVSTEYYAVPALGVNDYEWILNPPEAGTIQIISDKIEVKWNEDYKGQSELGIRAFYENNFTEWTYKYIEKVKTTSINSQSTDTAICAESSVILSVDAEGRELYYTWRKNGEIYSSGSDNLISFYSIADKNSGNYSCEITGMCGTTFTDNINIEVYPKTELNSTSPDLDLIIGESDLLEIIVEGHELSYSWQKEGIEIIGENLNYLAIDNSDAGDIGIYKAYASGTCGNVESDSIYVFVTGNDKDEVEDVNVTIWPSLATDELFVAIDSDEIYNISIYDISGSFILGKTDCRYKTFIPIVGLSSGLYILKLESGNFQEKLKFVVN